eukprot:COSAG01_NODE_11238_length_1975_cov_31.190832_3_plen_108_part_00
MYDKAAGCLLIGCLRTMLRTGAPVCGRNKKGLEREIRSIIQAGSGNVANGDRESISERKQPAALNLRPHSLDKLRQIVTTAYGILERPAHFPESLFFKEKAGQISNA